ncbi:NAD binding domain of 6-phosphogluconate dehydrogenase-domain-containing protein [Parachaetomium inaequale]|uniref:3-hydroxyisobutyrate dehydrogenase n=1 Tax=Parachaetomium inaequale TaxID=2588326 RepID=A0AAN6PDZ7_9PEZI|nr:NAD binding domain of 6-phosphogluconate dehydrogenase-domain-containing protein [Parachaetomium inaequale]
MSSPSEALPKSIGFIGLGAMGKPMATNLARSLPPGSHIHAHDTVEAPVDEFCTSFPDIAVKCASARELAEKSEVVLTMLPEGAHVRSVYLDATTGIIAALSSSSPKLLIDCSTIDTATSLHVKEHLLIASPKTSYYDAPVSGGVLGAVNGTVAFFLGCCSSDPNIPHLTRLLQSMGGKVIPCGGPSLGLAAKLSNNYLSGIITIACSEAMDMGMRAGIDARVLASVFAAGTAQNAICDVFNPVPGVCPQAPSSNGYRGGFRVQLMRKDIGLAVDMARRGGSRNALGVSGLGVYAAASEAADCKDLDSRVVYRYLGGREEWEGAESGEGVEKL